MPQIKKQKSVKRAWTDEEDQKLVQKIMETGPLKWDYISSQIGGVRTGKQCRERWHNQLNPLLKRNVWNVEEEWLLYLMKQRVSNHWSDMAIELLGRSDNTIKNYWNSNQKRF